MPISPTVGSAFVGGASSLLSTALGTSSVNKQYENWRRSYAIQRKDALADYERQRSDYVSDLLRSKSREVQSLLNAGLSPATAVESGFSPNAADTDIRSADGSSFTAPSFASDAASIMGSTVSAMLSRSQERKNNAEASNLETTTQQLQERFTNWLENQRDPENLKLQQEAYKSVYDALEARLQNAKTTEETEKIKKEKDEIDARISNYNASTQSITFNTSKAAALLPKELAKIQSSIQADLASAKASLASANESNARAYLTRIQSQFTKLGIGIGSNWVDSAVALCKGLGDGGATTIANSLTSIFNQVLSGFKPDSYKNIGAAKDLFKGFSNNIDKLGPGATSLFWPFLFNAFSK